MLLLLCCGAEIDSLSIRDDKTDILPELSIEAVAVEGS